MFMVFKIKKPHICGIFISALPFPSLFSTIFSIIFPWPMSSLFLGSSTISSLGLSFSGVANRHHRPWVRKTYHHRHMKRVENQIEIGSASPTPGQSSCIVSTSNHPSIHPSSSRAHGLRHICKVRVLFILTICLHGFFTRIFYV